MRSWSSLLARVSMTGKSPDDDDRIEEFIDEVVIPAHHVVSYDPKGETVIVLSADAARHLRDLINDHGCDMCERINYQLEVQELRHGPDDLDTDDIENL